jgi:peptidyl-prolyl cis-trans isomerase D
MRIIFTITIIGFLAGAFIGFGGYLFSDKFSGDFVAQVNGVKIPYRDYSRAFNMAIENTRSTNQPITDETTKSIKDNVIQQLISQEVLWQECKKYGITIPDSELAFNIQNAKYFQREGKFDQRLYFQILTQYQHITPHEFEEIQRKQIAIFRLRQLIASCAHLSMPEIIMELTNMDKKSKNNEKFAQDALNQKTSLVFNDWFSSLNKTNKIRLGQIK